jgi:hypothetical protein
MRSWGNWLAESKDRLYLLNVCGHLIAHDNIHNLPVQCTGTRSFGCSLPRSSRPDSSPSGKDLGMFARPRLLHGELYLQSDGGSQPGAKLAPCEPTRIVFKCDKTAGLGTPRFVSSSTLDDGTECGVVFEWATGAACPLVPQVGPHRTCSVVDPTLNFEYDMSPLQSSAAGGKLSVTGSVGQYSVAVCGSTEGTVALADGKGELAAPVSLGTPDDALYFTADGSIEQRYTGGADCIEVPLDPGDDDDDDGS